MRPSANTAAVELRTLAVLALLACSLCLAPSARAAAPSGAISGAVSEASTHTPIVGLPVCALSSALFEEQSESINLGGECATTGTDGDYTVSKLPPGKYIVIFGGLFGSGLNYISQYYEGKRSLDEANVSVAAEKTTTGIDAELEQGGEISGTVTNASTGAPIVHLAVCAIGPVGQAGDEQLSCAGTSANGEYLLAGLATGNFAIVFFGEGYLEQVYDGRSSLAEANLVSVTRKNVTSGIDVALQPATSSPFSGLSSSSSEGASEGGLIEPQPLIAPPAASAQASLSLANARLSVTASGTALVKLDCRSQARCQGKITLTAKRLERRKGKTVSVNVSIGTVSVSIPGTRAVTVRLKLGAVGRGLLRADHGHVGARLTISEHETASARTSSEGVLLLEQKAPTRR